MRPGYGSIASLAYEGAANTEQADSTIREDRPSPAFDADDRKLNRRVFAPTGAALGLIDGSLPPITRPAFFVSNGNDPDYRLEFRVKDHKRNRRTS